MHIKIIETTKITFVCCCWGRGDSKKVCACFLAKIQRSASLKGDPEWTHSPYVSFPWLPPLAWEAEDWKPGVGGRRGKWWGRTRASRKELVAGRNPREDVLGKIMRALTPGRAFPRSGERRGVGGHSAWPPAPASTSPALPRLRGPWVRFHVGPGDASSHP